MINEKILSVDKLNELKKRVNSKAKNAKEILLCAGASCIASGALKIKEALIREMKENNLDIPIKETGCMGPCSGGPVLVINPGNIFYEKLEVEDIPQIVSEHLAKGIVVKKLLPQNMDEIDFIKQQEKIVLKNCGKIDPLNIEEYIALDGYQAIVKAITKMNPHKVIEEVKVSGLRGRGGGGFPTGLKWSFCKSAPGNPKYVLCNADEGDPGSFMDRSVLEGDPHAIIEGMMIAGFAIGATEGFIYVRPEYPLAVERLTKALDQARTYGLLGKNILGLNFDFDLEIKMASGAFVCGEETALMRSIEGKRGEPRHRPPFSSVKGLWEKPSVLNNVETFANVAGIILNGANECAKFGTEDAKGTKIFALAGDINHSGLVEVPMGTSLGKVIYDIGGGIPNGKKFKAAHLGSSSGGCIPKEHLNVPLTYETLKKLGAIIGSGDLLVMDENTCMVDVARFFIEFTQEESCGKCTPCRVGTKRMLEILENICAGDGKEGDIEKLISLGENIKKTALCGLGQTAPNPVLSTIRFFREEYEQHIRDKFCIAGVCPDLVRAPCQTGCPAGVDVPGLLAFTAEGRFEEAIIRQRERNPFLSICGSVCFHPCEVKCKRNDIDNPVSVRGVKKFLAIRADESFVPEVRENKENAKKKIAIIGGGPAGLSAAFFLARLGYKPEVFEKEDRPGGMLIQAIPAYRLSRAAITQEIEIIKKIGVKITTNYALGKDYSLKEIEKKYDATFLSIGASKSWGLNIKGSSANNIIDAISFLRKHNLTGKTQVGKKVVVIGGGNTAMDTARTSIRLGAEQVTVLYRRSQEQMTAYKEEVHEAIAEKVKLMILTNPIEIIKDSNGAVKAVKCQKMMLGEFDTSGRKSCIENGDSPIIIEADQVIVAIGQSLNFPENSNINLNKKGYIKTDKYTMQTSKKGIFAGGDASGKGPNSVIDAISDGEKAAFGIDKYLTGHDNAFWRLEKDIDTNFDINDDPINDDRKPLPHLSIAERKCNFREVETVWETLTDGKTQAKRCLRCDYGKDIKKGR